jgi:hypothetical protein
MCYRGVNFVGNLLLLQIPCIASVIIHLYQDMHITEIKNSYISLYLPTVFRRLNRHLRGNLSTKKYVIPIHQRLLYDIRIL